MNHAGRLYMRSIEKKITYREERERHSRREFAIEPPNMGWMNLVNIYTRIGLGCLCYLNSITALHNTHYLSTYPKQLAWWMGNVLPRFIRNNVGSDHEWNNVLIATQISSQLSWANYRTCCCVIAWSRKPCRSNPVKPPHAVSWYVQVTRWGDVFGDHEVAAAISGAFSCASSLPNSAGVTETTPIKNSSATDWVSYRSLSDVNSPRAIPAWMHEMNQAVDWN